MQRSLLRQCVVFGIIFFNLLILFDMLTQGFGPPGQLGAKLVTTVVSTVIYGGLLWWLQQRKKRGE